MSPELFSRRYNLRGAPEELIYDDIPNTARTGFLYIFDKYKQYIIARLIVKEYCEAKRMLPGLLNQFVEEPRNLKINDIEQWLKTENWWEFLDLCELISLSLNKYPRKRGEFSKKLNSLFREEKIGYEIQEGKIERKGNEYTSQYIAEARKLLKGLEFKSADELFEKAIKALNERPKPDVENCIKDAVAAIESVGKIISKDEKAELDNIIKDATRKGIIPTPLDQTIIKLHAYRGKEPAVAHGGTKPSKVTVDEAEFVLAMAAAIIIYIVKKRSSF